MKGSFTERENFKDMCISTKKDLINKELLKKDFKSEDELNKFIEHIKALIEAYEQDLYDSEAYTKQDQLLIKTWRSKLYILSQKRDTLVISNDVPDVLESTMKILHRQISKLDDNTALLSKGTIKLMGLDYTNDDIDKALLQTKERILKNKSLEDKEIRLMYISVIVFLIMCCFVLLNKFVL